MKNKLATLALIVLMPAISHALSFTSSSGLLLPSNIAYTDADNNFSQTQTFQYGVSAATGTFTGAFDIGGNFTFGAANYKSTSTAASGALAIAGALTAPSVNVTGQVGGATGAFTGAVDIAGQTTIGAAATKSTMTTTGDISSYRDLTAGRNLSVVGTSDLIGQVTMGAAATKSTATAAGDFSVYRDLNVGRAVVISSTGYNALTVGGGIIAGTGTVGIVDATGKIPAISSTYFASVAGGNLTGLTPANVSAGVFPVDVVASSVAISAVGNDQLAGSIADSKLSQITTANKVAISALGALTAAAKTVWDAATPAAAYVIMGYCTDCASPGIVLSTGAVAGDYATFAAVAP